MNNKLAYQSAFIAAILALVGIVVIQFAAGQMPEGVSAQPYAISTEEFAATINQHASSILLFFAGDTLFPLSYLLVFVGLYLVTVRRVRAFALVGLGAGIVTAIFDTTENAFFITYATMAHNGVDIAQLDVLPIYILTTLKWTAGFATLYAFGLIFPRETLFERIIMALMLVFPLFGAVSVASPSLIPLRGLFLLIGMILFAIYFWQAQASVQT